LGLLPFQIVWTHLGTTLRNLSKISTGEVELSLWQQISMAVQVLMAIALLGYFYYLSRKINMKQEDTTDGVDNIELHPTTQQIDLEKGNSASTITT
jgi:hypothetical protein